MERACTKARHVEAYARYIDEKLGVRFPINPGLGALLVIQILRQVGLLSDKVRELLSAERLARPDALST